ncbi:MAG: L,D-transpeptidase family protein [Rhodothermales bacterium]
MSGLWKPIVLCAGLLIGGAGGPAGVARAQSMEDIRLVVASEAEAGRVYALRGFVPAWTVDGLPTALADSALALLAAAGEEGIVPTRIGFDELVRTRVLTDIAPLSPAWAARFDVGLTAALLRYGAMLRRGVVAPGLLHPGWRLREDVSDLPEALDEAVRYHRVRTFVERAAPRDMAYRRLKQALARLARIDREGGWPALPDGAPLEPGDARPEVAVLRQQLAVMGDLPGGSNGSNVYDSTLALAVRRFQSRHGLVPDAVVGQATRNALNVTAHGRLHQVALNMERLRWMPASDSVSIVVNIAGCRLDVVEDGRSVLSMPVIVGAADTHTPVFDAVLTGVTLAPYWYAPVSIAEKEILPAAQLDSTYLTRHHMQILPSGTIRQDPGPTNPLGRVKFTVSNPFDIGLHDTPERRLFGSERCTFSHGCVRLGNPMDLAAYVLAGDSTWTPARIASTIAAWVETPIALRRPIPLRVVYLTAWVDGEGVLHFREDRYGHDATLERFMDTP